MCARPVPAWRGVAWLSSARRASAWSAAACITVALAIAIAVALPPARVRACAACASGDPTLTVMGAEQPFAGRLRAALRTRVRGDRLGDVRLLEARSDLTVAWTPHPRLTLSAEMPLVLRSVSIEGEARRTAFAPGDAELRARGFVYRHPSLAPRHLLAVVGGVAVPTGVASSADVGLPRDALVGTGVWSPLLGVSYAYFAGQFSLFASAVGYARLGTMDGEAPGESVRVTVAGQAQLTPALALRAAADARVDARVRTIDGQRERGTGGGIVFVGLDVVASLGTDVLLVAGLRVPVAQVLEPGHVETALGEVALAVDL